jgi:hypothetical protein
VPEDHISMCKLNKEFYQSHILPIIKTMENITEEIEKVHTPQEKTKEEANMPESSSNSSNITQTHYGDGDNIGGDKIINNNHRDIHAKNYFEKITNKGTMNFD